MDQVELETEVQVYEDLIPTYPHGIRTNSVRSATLLVKQAD